MAASSSTVCLPSSKVSAAHSYGYGYGGAPGAAAPSSAFLSHFNRISKSDPSSFASVSLRLSRSHGSSAPIMIRASSPASSFETPAADYEIQGWDKAPATSMFSTIPGSQPYPSLKTSSKVTVVGVGNVGMACAQTCLTENLLNELALVDVNAEKLCGEMLDLQHAAAFLPRVKIVADTDYSITAGSDICIVTAGARQRDGETRLSLLDRNVSLFKNIIPQLVKYSPDTILLIVSNPVDILTYISWKLSGLPPNRVIGTGTNLDSSRLRFLVADEFNVNAHNIHGYMVGEHGDSSVPLWSGLTVANVPVLNLKDKNGDKYTKESLKSFHKAVVNSAYEVIKLKGYTSWAIGYSTSSLVKSLLRDQRRIHPVSVLAKGFLGIEEEVYLSLPSQLGRSGVLGVANLHLMKDEVQQVQNSAKTIWETQNKIEI